MENNCYPFVNIPLPYDDSALEPYIDEQTMRLHHDKHLQTYIDNLNSALEQNPRLQRLTLEQLIRTANCLSEPLKASIQHNAGGVYNHRFFFSGLKPPVSSIPDNRLLRDIDRFFGSYNAFKECMKKAALSVFGSGYAWLVYERGRLKIVTTANQDSPLAQGACPILCIDVWEHAYYLKHYNKRADYINDWFSVVDFEQANLQLLHCLQS